MKCDERTAALSHRGTDRQTTDRLWYAINIAFFRKEKKGIIIKAFRPETNPQWIRDTQGDCVVLSERGLFQNKVHSFLLKIYKYC